MSDRSREMASDPLYVWLCDAIDAESDPDQKLGLQRLCTRLKLHWTTQRGWMRDAREALAGDLRALRDRVEMHDAGPVDVVLSAPALPPSQ